MIRDIRIKAVLNGFVCQVGCQTVVFSDRAKLLHDLGHYLEEPDKTEEEYRKSSLNRTILNEPCLPQPTERFETSCDSQPQQVGQGLRR